MITGIVATPNLCLLDMLYSSEVFGYKFMHYSSKYAKRYRVVKPSRLLYFADVRPVFFDTFRHFNEAYARLNLTEHPYLVLISGNPIDHIEHGLEIWEGSVLKSTDLLKLSNGRQRPTKKVTDLIKEITKSVGGIGVLQKIYPLFYREKDKVARGSLQRAVYAYMSGVKKRCPSTHIQLLNRVLKEDAVQQLRNAAIASRTIGLDKAAKKFKVDLFELSYLRNKV